MTDGNFIFLGSARCFHTIDWYNRAENTLGYVPYFISDQIDGEGFPCLVPDKSKIHPLLRVDRFLFSKQSHLSHRWRNILKIFLIPAQIIILVWYNYRFRRPVFFAHSTYYAFLARFAGLKYISTPQGSEVLVRPDRSRAYRWFAQTAHKSAEIVTVDSLAMKKKLMSTFNQKSIIIQNGIDMKQIRPTVCAEKIERKLIVSLRGVQENYRIINLLDERNSHSDEVFFHICFPFYDEDYLSNVKMRLKPSDVLLGRLDKLDLYNLLRKTKIVISIPESDSSPRSVYEAVFCGCIVIAQNNDYVRGLPKIMQERIVVTECETGWLSVALNEAQRRMLKKFEPTEDILKCFDQKYSLLNVLEAYETNKKV